MCVCGVRVPITHSSDKLKHFRQAQILLTLCTSPRPMAGEPEPGPASAPAVAHQEAAAQEVAAAQTAERTPRRPS